jgi:penicillin-binding protein 1A
VSSSPRHPLLEAVSARLRVLLAVLRALAGRVRAGWQGWRARRRAAAATAGRARASLPRRLLRGAGLLAGAAVLVALVSLAWLWPRCVGDTCPSAEALRTYTPPQASRVLDRNGELVGHLAAERRVVVPLARIPPHVQRAFLAVEDRRFREHGGVDLRRALGALVRDLRTLRYDQGFSTITMQLARNLFPEHLSRAKTLRRKVWEVVLARDIEAAFSKDDILELYLNQIYLGEGLYGVEAAAQGYFGKGVERLTPSEGAVLAALPKAPSYYNPRKNPQAARTRRDLVLRLMAEEGVVPAARAAALQKEPLKLAPRVEARREAPYFVEAVTRELAERFGPGAESAGLRVLTGLDLGLQRAAEAQLARQLEALEKGRFGPWKHGTCTGQADADPARCLQALYVALDPRTGDVLAQVGGRDWAMSQFDRATQARRQGGSAFKPVVWAAALAYRIPVTTPLVPPEGALSEEALLAGVEGAPPPEDAYRPADAAQAESGAGIDLREGLRNSSNRAAVALGNRVGHVRVAETARALGLTTPVPPFPSTFLGAAEVVPLELVAAYAPFANGGSAVRPRYIRRVEDAQGQVLWEAPVESQPALSPPVAHLTLDLMQDVVARGTGQAVRTAGLPEAVPAAGKTGTTNDAADVWFVGMTPDLVAGVWMGFDRPQRILQGASGGRLAAPVWGRIAADYYRRRPAPAPWRAPGELVSREVDAHTGQLANPECPLEQVRGELFLPGTEPQEPCAEHGGGVGGWLRRTFEGFGSWGGEGRGGEDPEREARRRFERRQGEEQRRWEERRHWEEEERRREEEARRWEEEGRRREEQEARRWEQ